MVVFKLLIKSQTVGFLSNTLLIDQTNLVEKKESFKQENSFAKILEVINNKK